MLPWLPFIMISIGLIGAAIHQWQVATTRRLRRLLLIGFIWVLAAFCMTPTSYNFGSTAIMHYFQWGPVILNVIPFQLLDLEFWLNVALTIPLGSLLCWNFPNWRWSTIVFAGLITGLSLEGGQLILDLLVNLKRWVDIDDLLTNWLGVILGYSLVLIIRRLPGFKWLN